MERSRISDSGAANATTSRRYFVVTAVAIVALAVAVRVREAGLTRLWFDEIYTLWVARLPLDRLLATVAADVHPPLHFLLVAAWRAIGGESDVWIRSLSVVAGVATVAALIQLGRTMAGPTAGLLAAALLTLHRTHVFFSTESRAYALLWLWLTLAVWFAWRWLETRRPRDGAVYVVCAVAALYTHYLAGIVLAFLALWVLVDLRGERRHVPAWLALNAAVVVGFAPQLPTLLAQVARNTAEHWLQPPGLGSLVNLARHSAFGMTALIVPLGLLAALPLLRPSQRRAASLLWTITLLPVLLCWLLSRAGLHLYSERYMFFVLPGASVLVAAGIAGLRRRWVGVTAALVVLVAGARSLALSRPLPEAVEQAAALERLQRRVAGAQTILAADTHSLLFMRHHWPQHERTRLLWLGAEVPYYDAALVIPHSWIVGPATLDSLARMGAPWFAIHTHNSGSDVSAAIIRIQSLAGPPELTLELVKVWLARSEPGPRSHR
ncbi:MAG TPA: glycosyltransferase family 39 protein [Candidatus Limnocylindria bacterium]|nr:glycosyltransferase family 39 protein [Candidatus Limnocylindria bacterium]